MKKAFCRVLLVLLSALALFGCHNATSKEPAVIRLSSSRVTLANGRDQGIVQADVRASADQVEGRLTGEPVPDGTLVTFSMNDNGQLSTLTALTSQGLATIALTHPPISGAPNETVKIAAAAGNVSATWGIKFINQPSSADVYVAVWQIDPNLAALRFSVKSSAGASFDNSTQQILIQSGIGTAVTGSFDPALNSTTINLSFAGSSGSSTLRAGTTDLSIEPTQPSPFKVPMLSPPPAPPAFSIKMTFALAPDSGMPSFRIDESAPFIATDRNGNAVLHPAISEVTIDGLTFDTEF